MATRNPDYNKPYGTWKVTTEGDCEGRSIRDLGTHEGYLDDIAFKLANKSYYSLTFHLIPDDKKIDVIPKSGTKVNVSLDIDSGTWPSDMNSKQRVEFFQNMLRGRDTFVTEGQYYASVTLIDGQSPEARAIAEQKLARATALSKLSAADRLALGIKE